MLCRSRYTEMYRGFFHQLRFVATCHASPSAHGPLCRGLRRGSSKCHRRYLASLQPCPVPCKSYLTLGLSLYLLYLATGWRLETSSRVKWLKLGRCHAYVTTNHIYIYIDIDIRVCRCIFMFIQTYRFTLKPVHLLSMTSFLAQHHNHRHQ